MHKSMASEDFCIVFHLLEYFYKTCIAFFTILELDIPSPHSLSQYWIRILAGVFLKLPEHW